MEHVPFDSSGTDDDLPPPLPNRAVGGVSVSGIGMTAAHLRVQNDMEAEITRLEKEAYGSVLRAFKAQSDAISWDKESLITELRKELRISDEDHREFMNTVNADDTIHRIREWRQTGGLQSSFLNKSQPSSNILASRRRPKASQFVPSHSYNVPSLALHPHPPSAFVQATASAAKKSAASISKCKKPKQGQTLPDVGTIKPVRHPSGLSGRGQVANKSSYGEADFSGDGALRLIGRKVRTRWPEDNNFYEAVITEYNRDEDRHTLVYGVNAGNITYESVDLKEISPDDIQWVDGEDTGISGAGRSGPERTNKKQIGRAHHLVPDSLQGRGSLKAQLKKGFPPPQSSISKKSSSDIMILSTDNVIKEVERVFNATHPDPREIEKAKQLLNEHEQSLIDAIARLEDVSDNENGSKEH